MNPDYEDLQKLLRTFFEREVTRNNLQDAGELPGHIDSHTWKRMSVELGIAGLTIPEEHDGGGADLEAGLIVLRELGRVLAPVPYLSTFLSIAVLTETADTELQAQLFPQISSGELIVATALGDHELTADSANENGSFMLTGIVPHLLDAQAADFYLVQARESDGGRAWFLVDSTEKGIERRDLDGYELLRSRSQITFVQARGKRLRYTAEDTYTKLQSLALMAVAAENVGGIEACVDAATQYAKLRVQFGRAIGSFQAVKHRLANMAVEMHEATATLTAATHDFDSHPADHELYARLAYVASVRAYKRVSEDNIQIHGGIGYTWEHDAHLYFRRAYSAEAFWGSVNKHLDNIATKVNK